MRKFVRVLSSRHPVENKCCFREQVEMCVFTLQDSKCQVGLSENSKKKTEKLGRDKGSKVISTSSKALKITHLKLRGPHNRAILASRKKVKTEIIPEKTRRRPQKSFERERGNISVSTSAKSRRHHLFGVRGRFVDIG